MLVKSCSKILNSQYVSALGASSLMILSRSLSAFVFTFLLFFREMQIDAADVDAIEVPLFCRLVFKMEVDAASVCSVVQPGVEK